MTEQLFPVRPAITIAIMTASLAIAAVACNKQPGPTQQAGGTEVTATAQDPQAPLVLSGYTIHRVKLPYAHKAIGEKGDQQSFSNAWLVVLSLRNLGRPAGLTTDFYVGEYRIPEYGGVTNGIYFRIYDEAKLRSLDGQEISVREPGMKRRKLDQTFILPDLKSLQTEEERAVLKRGNK